MEPSVAFMRRNIDKSINKMGFLRFVNVINTGE